MRIVMTTHARTPSYFFTSIDALFAATPAHVFDEHPLTISVHEPTAACIGPWAHDKRLKVRTLELDEHREKMQLATRAKVVHATKLALSLEPGEMLLLQDDIKFLPDWWARFQEALAALTDRDNTCLTLYSHLWGNPGTRPIEAAKWWGLQGMFFGENARRASVASLQLQPMDYSPIEKRVGADVRIGGMLVANQKPPEERRARPLPADDVRIQQMIVKHRGIKLWGTFPSLVQHTGKVSSIGSIMHGSPTYGDRKPLRMSGPSPSGSNVKQGGRSAESWAVGPTRPPRIR